MTEVRTPGELLGAADEFKAGEGVYESNGLLRAAVVGIEQRLDPANEEDLPTISILRSSRSRASVARVGSVVLGQVAAVGRTRVEVSIIAVDGHVISEPYKGSLRSQDVCETVVENSDITDFFIPGDIIRAEVDIFVLCCLVTNTWRKEFDTGYRIQLSTDGRQFLLGTASDDLGVLCADSKAGGALQPISASLMRCSLTGKLERRKVAKPPQIPSTSPK